MKPKRLTILLLILLLWMRPSAHAEEIARLEVGNSLWLVVDRLSQEVQRQRFAETGLPKSLLVQSLEKFGSTYGTGEIDGMLRTTLSVTVKLPEALSDSLFLISCDEHDQPTDYFVLPLTNLSIPPAV